MIPLPARKHGRRARGQTARPPRARGNLLEPFLQFAHHEIAEVFDGLDPIPQALRHLKVCRAVLAVEIVEQSLPRVGRSDRERGRRMPDSAEQFGIARLAEQVIDVFRLHAIGLLPDVQGAHRVGRRRHVLQNLVDLAEVIGVVLDLRRDAHRKIALDGRERFGARMQDARFRWQVGTSLSNFGIVAAPFRLISSSAGFRAKGKIVPWVFIATQRKADRVFQQGVENGSAAGGPARAHPPRFPPDGDQEP
jgi:hypothetical protein